MTVIIRIEETETNAVSAGGAVLFAAKGYPYIARILATVPFYVLVGTAPVATTGDTYMNEFDDDTMLAVGAHDAVSILGTDIGTVWVTEVKRSS